MSRTPRNPKPPSQRSHKSHLSCYHDSPSLWKPLLLAGVKEDGWPWDWTSIGIRPKKRRVQAKIVAKSDGVWAADGLVRCLSSVTAELASGEAAQLIRAKSRFQSGRVFRKTETLCEWSGTPELILALERPFLNLAAYACGIATATRKIVDLVREACPERTPRVTATRKTLPGYRDIALHAVQAGGGFSHRVNLAGGVLIKENHIAAAGGIDRAIEAARSVAPHGLKIEVEVRNKDELSQALYARADGILLDNFTPKEVMASVALVARACDAAFAPVVEVSGGLNEDTIQQYAIPGVDVLSLGSLTHSVRASDLSLLVD